MSRLDGLPTEQVRSPEVTCDRGLPVLAVSMVCPPSKFDHTSPRCWTASPTAGLDGLPTEQVRSLRHTLGTCSSDHLSRWSAHRASSITKETLARLSEPVGGLDGLPTEQVRSQQIPIQLSPRGLTWKSASTSILSFAIERRYRRRSGTSN